MSIIIINTSVAILAQVSSRPQRERQAQTQRERAFARSLAMALSAALSSYDEDPGEAIQRAIEQQELTEARIAGRAPVPPPWLTMLVNDSSHSRVAVGNPPARDNQNATNALVIATAALVAAPETNASVIAPAAPVPAPKAVVTPRGASVQSFLMPATHTPRHTRLGIC